MLAGLGPVGTTERRYTMNHNTNLKRDQEDGARARQALSVRSGRPDLMNDMGTRVSTLWMVVMFSMIFADILSFMMPGTLQAASAGQVGVPVTQGLLLVFAILLEIPIAMIFVSRVLKPAANRWVNTAAALVTTAFVIGGGSPYLHYWFFEIVQIVCMALIVWSVWSPRGSENTSLPSAG